MRRGAWHTADERAAARAMMKGIRKRHPRLRSALAADLRVVAANRAERSDYSSKFDALAQLIRLAWVSDAFFAQILYRIKASLQRRGVPLLPRLAHRWAMSSAQVCIGDPVVVHPGIYLAHGQVVIDGTVEVHSGTVIFPFVTVGLRAGNFQGPTIGPNVHIGTGAKVIGPITIGAGAAIGANSVVITDVDPGATVVGAPARAVST
jgi:serine O-acetyltransferase